MKINVISDLHLAKKWNGLSKVFPKKINYLNPNKEFKKLITKFDKKDLLVFNGDLIDYHYSDYFSENDNNWNIFNKIITNFKGKYLINLGNHDYRKSPYNFDIYGLNHINISEKIRKKYKNGIGHNKFRYFSEFNSIKAIKTENIINNKPSKFKNINKNTSIVLLNTGPDGLNYFSELINPFRWPNILSSHPSSYGLTDEDIKKLDSELKDEETKNIIIFVHCPPFQSKNKINNIKLKKYSYNFSLYKNGLTYFTFGKNNWKFIEKLIKCKKNIIVISSHSHIPKSYVIDKNKNLIMDSDITEINNLYNNSNYIKFVSTLPLGAITEEKNIGYLTINKDKIKYNIIKTF